MSEPRFYVLEHTGHMDKYPGIPPTTASPPRTEVMILDRAYCHRVVWSRLSGQRVERRRLFRKAERLAAEWNEEDSRV